MRNTNLTSMLMLAAMAAGCATHHVRTESAAGDVSPALSVTTTTSSMLAIPSDEELMNAYTDASMDLVSRVNILDRRAAAIDNRLPGGLDAVGYGALARNVVFLNDGAFSDITDERWSSMESYYDRGSSLRKLRMVPDLTRNDTEEFYYDDAGLIMVYWNPNGIGAQDAFGQSGESFYFGQSGLISWIRDDGTVMDPTSADFKYWDEQLRKEALRFPEGSR